MYIHMYIYIQLQLLLSIYQRQVNTGIADFSCESININPASHAR